MTSISAGARINPTPFVTTPAGPVGQGLVIQNLDYLPDSALVVTDWCTLSLVIDTAATSAGRLAA
ncbi:hypothetical protein ACFV9E_05025 [Streptomyces sp. NPDC059835]|uniref:hypothetical protein n=1 Tax=Streptomyces sp. NPDC059835 TaxID=3346967 RepID=UPI0036695741